MIGDERSESKHLFSCDASVMNREPGLKQARM